MIQGVIQTTTNHTHFSLKDTQPPPTEPPADEKAKPKEPPPGRKMTTKGLVTGAGSGLPNTSGGNGNGNGHPTSRRILVLAQKGDWTACDSSLKVLEKESVETGHRHPLSTVSDNVSTNFYDSSLDFSSKKRLRLW